ncbi:hypothetical protein HC256_002668 [Beauveria bassiana]|nr:hypothetical protein HC256_002668 [Beauveria bassiana]
MSSASVFISFLRSVATDTFTSDSMAHLGVGLPACDLGMTQYRFGRAGWVGHCTQHNWYTPTVVEQWVGSGSCHLHLTRNKWANRWWSRFDGLWSKSSHLLFQPLLPANFGSPSSCPLLAAGFGLRQPPHSYTRNAGWHTVLRNAATTQPGGQDVASNDLLVGCYIETYL